MITYNDIYEAVRKERSEELQTLPKDFLEEVANYLREKKNFSVKNADDFSEETTKVKKQLENTRTLFKELILRRRKKIMTLVLIAAETGTSKKDFENMLDFEKEMFDNLMKCLESTENQIVGFLNGKKENEEKISVLFKEDIGEFMDLNGEMLGPFKKGDKIELQKDIVKILVEDGKAEMIL